MEIILICMVKKENKRVMITMSPKTSDKVKELCNMYDMTVTELFKMMVGVFHQERISK